MRAAAERIDAFVIGAMKAATTAMCEWLDNQPGLAVSSPKEPAIYVTDDAASSWQGKIGTLFRDAATTDVRVEGSTDYAKFPTVTGVPARIARHHPEARFVYMLRHPVARTVSQYRFEWLINADDAPFSQALASRPTLLANSQYALQLEQWLDHFPPERFVLVVAEAFAADPEAQTRRVMTHLGLPSQPCSEPTQDRANDTAQLVRRSLARRVLRDSRVGRLVRPAIPSVVARSYHRRLQSRASPTISAADRESMVATFDQDLARLRTLTGGPDLTCATWNDLATTWTPTLLAR